MIGSQLLASRIQKGERPLRRSLWWGFPNLSVDSFALLVPGAYRHASKPYGTKTKGIYSLAVLLRCHSYHGVMKSVALRNTIEGVEAEMRIPLLSPLVKDVEIVRKRAKRTRAKLYYLRDRSVQENTFD